MAQTCLSLALRLFSFVFVFLLSLKPRPFVQSLRSSICMRPQPHAVTLNKSLCPFLFVSLRSFFFFFGDVAFSEYFCTITVYSSLSMESRSYVFPFRMMFFYLVTTGWILDISAYYVRIQSINQSKLVRSSFKHLYLPCAFTRSTRANTLNLRHEDIVYNIADRARDA